MNSSPVQSNTVEKYTINTLERVFSDFPGQLTGYVDVEDWKKLSVEDRKQLLYSFGIDVNSYIEFKIKQLGIQVELKPETIPAQVAQANIVTNQTNQILPTETPKQEEVVKTEPYVSPAQVVTVKELIKEDEIKVTPEITTKDILEETKIETPVVEKIEIPKIEHEKYEESSKTGINELTQEEKERIAVETAKKSNTMSRTGVSLYGYQPSDDFTNSVKNYSSGSTKNGSTWLAVLFRKVKDMMLSA